VLAVRRHAADIIESQRDVAADNNTGTRMLTLVMTVALPKLRQTSSMYDIMRVLSKSNSSPSQYTKPSLHVTNDCTLTLDAEIFKALS
jgi:hypothetical protein